MFPKTKKCNFTYRFLQQEEYDNALALCLAVFDEAVASHNPPAGRDSFTRFINSDELKRLFQNGEFIMSGCFLEIDQNQVLIGVIGVKGLNNQPHISLLFVSQQYAKHNIGKKLIDFALGNKKDITVNASINAEGFYQSCGFQRTAGMVFEDGLKTVPMLRKSSYKAAKIISVALSALIPLIIIAVVLYLQRIYPFGSKSFLIYDLKSQYIDFYNAFSRVFSGELFYSFSRTLGGDNFTLNAYYLFSPYNLIMLLFDKNTMADGVLFVFILKVISSGLSFAVYAIHSKLISTRNGVFYFCLPAFATAYALCGFVASYSLNVFWLDALILLPLLSLSIERACKGKPKSFILVLALSLVVNFYFGYMFLFFSLTAYPAYTRLMGKTFSKKDFFACLKYLFTACMLSSIVTIPVFFGLIATKLSHASPLYIAFKNISFSDTVAVFELFIIIGVLSFIFVNIIRQNNKSETQVKVIDKKIKTAFAAAFVTLVIIIAIAEYEKLLPLFYQLFAFGNNVEVPPIFTTLIAIVLSVALLFIKGVSKRQRFWYFALPVFWFLTLICKPLYLIIHMGQNPLSYPGRQAFIFSFLILQGALIAVVKFTTKPRKHNLKIFITIIPFLMIGEIIINTNNALAVNEKSYYGFTQRDDYINFVNNTGAVIDQVKNEQEFFRIEKTYNRSFNDAYTFGTSGISHYSSMYENEVINTFNLMGLSASAYWAQYNGSTPVTDMLFGVQYVLDNKHMISFQKDYYNEEFSANGITVYRNPYALPLVMSATSDLNHLKADTINPFELQNKYTKAITGSNILPFNEITNYKSVEKTYRFDDGSPDLKVLEYTFKATEDSGLFLSLKYITKPVKIFIYSELICEYPSENNSGTIYLGKIEAGDNVFVTIETDANTEISKENIFFATLNPERLIKIFDSYNNIVEMQKVSPGRITTKVQGDTVFVSLPYSIGWNAVANGKKVETFNAGSGFLGVQLTEEGVNNLELVYTPPGLWSGVIVSMLGILMLYISNKTKWER